MMLAGEGLHSSTGLVALAFQVQKTQETQVPDKTSSLRHLFLDHPSSKNETSVDFPILRLKQ